MLPRTYLETSLISYVVGRPSRDVITLANQQLTREWWETQRLKYELFVSELVIAEAEIGDATVAGSVLIWQIRTLPSAELLSANAWWRVMILRLFVRHKN